MTRPPALHPDMAAALRQVQQLAQQGGDRDALSPAVQRSLMEAERRWWNEVPPPLPREWSFEVAGPVRPVQVHGFEPHGPRAGDWIVWLHGGGWVLGSTRTHASLLRGLALASGRTVFGVDYALAPEFEFPAPVEETCAVLAQLRKRAPAWGLDPACMAVGGDSSGANVALAAALQLQRRAPGAVQAGVFYYGVFDDDLASGSASAFGDGSFGLSVARMRAFWQHYVPDASLRNDGRVNLRHADLSRAFPMYLLAAECDILRDGAVRFAQRLSAAGVAHRLDVRNGMGHAFMGYGRMVPEVQAVHAEAASFLASLPLHP